MSTSHSPDLRVAGREQPPGGRRRPNRREVAAAATRVEILRAARQLFAERGYSQTSMADIAEEAGVSPPTIYASVGPKAAIVLALFGMVRADVGADRALERVSQETDPTELLALGVRLNRLLAQRAADIVETFRGAAHTEPAVAAAVAEGERQHLAGARLLAGRLAELGALRWDIDAVEAADVIALLADDEIFTRLVRGYGWSFDRAEAWLIAALRRTLLDGGEKGS
jgi:TetR/AcrR family transcriptional regulator, regulator of cefoperazone and chloramphenicol sensitivity